MKGKEELVWRFKKYLYGLKQSPRMWYTILIHTSKSWDSREFRLNTMYAVNKSETTSYM